MHVAWDKTRNLLPRGEERWQMVVVRGKKTLWHCRILLYGNGTPRNISLIWMGGLLLNWCVALGGYCKYEDGEWTAVHSEEEGRE